MIYNEKGVRLTLDKELKPFLEKIEQDYPGFKDGKASVIIEAKDSARITRQIYAGGKSTEESKMVRSSKSAPRPQTLTNDGFYLDDLNQKQTVFYSDVPPRFNAAGIPDFDAVSTPIVIYDGARFGKEEVEKAIFVYCMFPGIHGGSHVNHNSRFEFVHPEKKAATKRRPSPERILEQEILFEESCMKYEHALAIMQILHLKSAGNEDLDRDNLFEYVKAMKDRSAYEKAKASAIKEMPKIGSKEVSSCVNAGVKSGVIYEEEGKWKLKKSDVLSIDLCLVKGDTDKEKKFNLRGFCRGEFVRKNC